MTKTFNVRKLERKKNEGTNRQQQPDSDIHDTSVHCPRVSPSFNLLGLTVPEKSVTKHLTESQNHRMTEGQGKSSIAPTFSKDVIMYGSVQSPS